MNKLTRADIAPLAVYEQERSDFRRRIIELKTRRRIAVGPVVTLVFENRETVRFQIQEMLRVERIDEEPKVRQELEVYNGLIPDAGGTYFLPRRVGLARAKELVFTADIIDAREAERIGLVNRVVAAGNLEAETYALARRIADGPPQVLAAAKALLDRAPSLDLESALHWEALTQGSMIASADHREGLRAFFEKRPPRFSGG